MPVKLQIAILGASLTNKTELSLALRDFLEKCAIDLEVAERSAIESIKHDDVVLLCGLDLTTSSESQLVLDQEIRASLQTRGISFQVIYGQGSQCLQNALFCLAAKAPQWAHILLRSEAPVRWTGACETCGDGLCEHQLFSKLITGKK